MFWPLLSLLLTLNFTLLLPTLLSSSVISFSYFSLISVNLKFFYVVVLWVTGKFFFLLPASESMRSSFLRWWASEFLTKFIPRMGIILLVPSLTLSLNLSGFTLSCAMILLALWKHQKHFFPCTYWLGHEVAQHCQIS